MTLDEIKAAVDAGHTVCHKSEAYEVRKWTNGYHIVCTFNDYAIGLTWRDGVTMNGKPEDFYIQPEDPPLSFDFVTSHDGINPVYLIVDARGEQVAQAVSEDMAIRIAAALRGQA